MAWTLQQLRDNLALLAGFRTRDRIPCVCGRCGQEHTKLKRVVQISLSNPRQEHFFCTRSCSSQRQGEVWDVRNGVPGRVCKECQTWGPKSRLHGGRGWLCNTCIGKRPRSKFNSYQRRARVASISFALTYDQFQQFWQRPCAYCGAPIDTVGLDRLDNTKGYSVDNVVSCCPLCNAFKADLTVEGFIRRCRQIAERHPC